MTFEVKELNHGKNRAEIPYSIHINRSKLGEVKNERREGKGGGTYGNRFRSLCELLGQRDGNLILRVQLR